jgi:glycosyltransferase involved in cell wall biosynthesis
MKKVMFYISSLTKGGAERVIVNLAEEFHKNGHEVVIVTSTREEVEYTHSKEIKRYSIFNNSEKNSKRIKLIWVLKCILGLRKIIKREKTDFVISFLSINHAVLATRFLNTKCIVSVRNDPTNSYKSFASKQILKYVLSTADWTVFQTDDARQLFSNKIQKKSSIIFNPIKEDFFHVEYTPKSNLIINCGRLEKQKNHSMLLDAFSIVKKIKLDALLEIYGRGTEYENLKRKIEELDLGDSVKLMGVEENIAGKLKNASVFAMSSDYEGMPNALMESMAIGIPCISTNCAIGGPKILLSDNCGLLTPVGQPNKLAEGIIYLLDNPDEASLMGDNSKRKSRFFKQGEIYHQWLKLLEDLTGKTQ